MADIRDRIDADLTRLERDKAVADAQRAEAERNVLADVAASASVERDAAEYDRFVSTKEAEAAKQWAAQNAVARSDAERQALDSEVRAQSNAGALWVMGGLVVVLLLGWLIWYLNQPSAQPATGVSTTIVDHTAPPSAGAATPAPAAPAASSNTTTIVPVPVSTPAPVDNSAPPQAPPIVINNNPAPPATVDNSQNGPPDTNNSPGGAAPQPSTASGNSAPDLGASNSQSAPSSGAESDNGASRGS